MSVLEVRTTHGTSRVHIGESLSRLARHASGRRTVLITDAHVERLHGGLFPLGDRIVLPPGEASKSLATIERVYDRLLELEADRSTLIIGVGGGVVCDISGFAASTYLRGLPFGFAPTTLLAQVDAAVGGKNGVDFKGYKNLVGTFAQPEFVVCDPDILRTLPEREVVCGLAELVKAALVGDAELFAVLERDADRARALDRDLLLSAVEAALRVKAAVVEEDEREREGRRRLNFGHTLGHALESTTGLSHGEAVSVGMAFAAEWSVRRGLLAAEDRERILSLLIRLGLPTVFRAPRAQILDAVRKDKKRAKENVRFVFLEGVGRPLVLEVPLTDLERAIHDLC